MNTLDVLQENITLDMQEFNMKNYSQSLQEIKQNLK